MAVGVPVMQMARVRQNYLAIVVAAVACFLLEAGWYSVFMNTWLNGIGRSMQWLMSSGVNPAIQYATALVMAAVMATAISCVIQLTGKQTALRGIKVGALLWAGFEMTTFSTEYIFEVRPIGLLAGQRGLLVLRDDADGGDCGGVEEEG